MNQGSLEVKVEGEEISMSNAICLKRVELKELNVTSREDKEQGIWKTKNTVHCIGKYVTSFSRLSLTFILRVKSSYIIAAILCLNGHMSRYIQSMLLLVKSSKNLFLYKNPRVGNIQSRITLGRSKVYYASNLHVLTPWIAQQAQ